jgi:hypothetical protein
MPLQQTIQSFVDDDARLRCQPLFLVFRLTGGFLTYNLRPCHEDCELNTKGPSIT